MFKSKYDVLKEALDARDRHIDRLEKTIDKLMQERLFYLRSNEPMPISDPSPREYAVTCKADPEPGEIFHTGE